MTFAEREQAFLRYANCLKQHGIDVVSYKLYLHGDERVQLKQLITMTEEEQKKIDTDCYHLYYEVVSTVYGEQHRLSVAEQAKFLTDVAECMRQAGVETKSAVKQDELSRLAPRVYSTCSEQLNP